MDPRRLWIRAILIALWAGAANLWAERHFGIGLDDPVSLLGLTGGWTAFFMVLDRFLGGEEKNALRTAIDDRVRGILRRTLLSTPALALLYLGGGIVAATYSSVTVVPPRQGRASVAIAAIDGNQILRDGSVSVGGAPARLGVATTPFGRDLRLSVKGYVGRTVTVFPLSGLTVDPEADLVPLPTLLIRPSVETFAALGGGGAIEVFRVEGVTCHRLGRLEGPEPVAALMIGPRRLVPSGYTALWQMELQAERVDEAMIASAMLAWSRPTTIALDRSPEPGEQVYAMVSTRAGKRKSEAMVVVGRESFQDIPLQTSMDDAGPCKEMR